MRTDKLVTEVLGGDMALTPADILGKHFHRSMFGGYQNIEVDAFLERVADVFESLIKENRELKERVEESKAKLEEFSQMQGTLQSALVTSQKFGESVVESAKTEAENIIEAARVEAEKILVQASKLPDALAVNVARLQQQRERLRADMSALLATHKAILDGVESSEETPSGMAVADETVFFGVRGNERAEVENKNGETSLYNIADESDAPEEEELIP